MVAHSVLQANFVNLLAWLAICCFLARVLILRARCQKSRLICASMFDYKLELSFQLSLICSESDNYNFKEIMTCTLHKMACDVLFFICAFHFSYLSILISIRLLFLSIFSQQESFGMFGPVAVASRYLGACCAVLRRFWTCWRLQRVLLNFHLNWWVL